MKIIEEPTLVRAGDTGWQALVEPGVATAGIRIKVLRRDPAAGRAPTFLLRFAPGASYPNHRHPAGEEVFVLEGEARFGALQLEAGDYLYTPPGATHAVFSRTGCVMLLVVPEAVEVLRPGADRPLGPEPQEA